MPSWGSSSEQNNREWKRPLLAVWLQLETRLGMMLVNDDSILPWIPGFLLWEPSQDVTMKLIMNRASETPADELEPKNLKRPSSSSGVVPRKEPGSRGHQVSTGFYFICTLISKTSLSSLPVIHQEHAAHTRPPFLFAPLVLVLFTSSQFVASHPRVFNFIS